MYNIEKYDAEFDVVLQSAGNRKIEVIKVVLETTGIGLKNAKDLVDSAPVLIKKCALKLEAEQLRKKLTAAGANVLH